MNRRGFITGLIALGVTAPAQSQAQSLMPVKVLRYPITIYNNRIIQTYVDIESIRDRNILLCDNWRYLVRAANVECSHA